MNPFKKTVIAIATVSTLAVAAAAPAQAGWKKPFVQGLGFGVGLGVAGTILAPRPQTVVVAQPTYAPRCYTQAQQFYDAYGVLRVRHVQVCQ